MEISTKIDQLKDLLFVPIGTSGSMVFWTIDYLLEAKGKLKAIAFCSEMDKRFLVRNGTISEEDVIDITGWGTVGCRKRAEIFYKNKRALMLDILARKQPFSSALILSFTGGGTGRCGELFIRDLLEEFHGPPGFPKIMAIVKLPVHNQAPYMIRNTLSSLRSYKELFDKYEEQITVVVFSDGISLEQVPPRLKETLMERRVRWPDTSNIPIGDWCATILNAYTQPETNVSDFFQTAAQKPMRGSYGPFSVALILRSIVGKREALPRGTKKEEADKTLKEMRSKAKAELNGLIENLSSVIDVTTLKDVSFRIEERAGIYGCLWAPSVDNPDEQHREIEDFEGALKSRLVEMGVIEEDAFVSLRPIYQEGAETMDILGVLRGARFSFRGGMVDSANL
jgi:hypothetical protein